MFYLYSSLLAAWKQMPFPFCRSRGKRNTTFYFMSFCKKHLLNRANTVPRTVMWKSGGEMEKMLSLISDSNRGIHSLAAGRLLPFNPWFLCLPLTVIILWPEFLPGLKKIDICEWLLKIHCTSKILWTSKFWEIYFKDKINISPAQKLIAIYRKWSEESLLDNTNSISHFGVRGKTLRIQMWTSQILEFEGEGGLFPSTN